MSITIPEDGGLDRMKGRRKKTVAVSSAGFPFVLLPSVCLDGWPCPPCHGRLTPRKPWACMSLLSCLYQHSVTAMIKAADMGMDLGTELGDFRTCIL